MRAYEHVAKRQCYDANPDGLGCRQAAGECSLRWLCARRSKQEATPNCAFSRGPRDASSGSNPDLCAWQANCGRASECHAATSGSACVAALCGETIGFTARDISPTHGSEARVRHGSEAAADACQLCTQETWLRTAIETRPWFSWLWRETRGSENCWERCWLWRETRWLRRWQNGRSEAFWFGCQLWWQGWCSKGRRKAWYTY